MPNNKDDSEKIELRLDDETIYTLIEVWVIKNLKIESQETFHEEYKIDKNVERALVSSVMNECVIDVLSEQFETENGK